MCKMLGIVPRTIHSIHINYDYYYVLSDISIINHTHKICIKFLKKANQIRVQRTNYAKNLSSKNKLKPKAHAMLNTMKEKVKRKCKT